MSRVDGATAAGMTNPSSGSDTAAEALGSKPPTVLVVDDTAGNRYVVSRLLRSAGMGVIETDNGNEALRLIEQQPDLVVLDINLPDMTGYDVCREIKTRPDTAAIPVMHVSASYTANADRAYGLEAGADAYLTHPVDPDLFLATARALLRARRAEAAREAAHRERDALLDRTERALREAEAARREAEAANRAKSDFLAVMSHELRTPLNAIAGFTALIAMGIRGPVTPEQQSDLERIQRSQVALLALINDLLSFAKLESGSVHYETRDIVADTALAAASEFVELQLRAKAVRLVRVPCTPPVVLRGDPEKVQQILLNLLSNAVKFTDAGGTITLSAERVGDRVELSVSDTGTGIPADKIATIFDPFMQVDQRLTRQHHGVGLGLAISRDLARGMGGDLRVVSVEGEGSTFTLSLPTQEPAASPT